MKPIILLASLFVVGCGAGPAPTPTSLFAPTEAGPALSTDSSSAVIQRVMLESAVRWTTIQMQGKVTWYAADGSVAQWAVEQVWLDPLNSRYKSAMSGADGAGQRLLKISDGENIYDVELNSGHTETHAYPQSARVGQYVPALEAGAAHPNPIWMQIGTPISQLAFPSDFAQNSGVFKPIARETIAGREALVVEWTYGQNPSPSWKLWLDAETAVILKLQEFDKNGSGALSDERVVESIEYDGNFDASVFQLPPEPSPTIALTEVGSQPVVTAASPPSEKESGELYFFLQPHKPGSDIRLVRVAGICIVNADTCPPMQIVIVPFAFNFSIDALRWSPDGKFAAFAYSDDPHGTPTKLWRFDPTSGAWTSLAQFAYIDPPFWSPDGTWIAFRSQDGAGGEDVYVVHRDGTQLKKISTALPAAGRPYIMDGWYTENVIMRSAMPGQNGAIYLVRASDAAARPMFSTLLTKAEFIAAPDASSFAYDDYNYGSQQHALKVMEPDGANVRTVAQFNGGSIDPIVWSPDSKRLAFNYFRTQLAAAPSAEVYVVSRDGENLSSVYKGVTVGHVLFSPNGRYLLVEETTSISGGHLFVVDLATLEQKILQAPGLTIDFDWYAPSWRP